MGVGIISSIIASLIVILGGLLFAHLRSKHAEKAPIALYGIVGAACVAILIYTVMGREVFSFKQSVEITNDNVESHIKAWANDLGMAVSPAPSTPDVFFNDAITLKGGNVVAVARAKDKSGFLQFQSPLVIAPEHQAALAKLTVEEANIVMEEILLELARSKIGYVFVGGPQTAGTQQAIGLQSIVVQSTLPIAGNINEAMFSAKIDEIIEGLTIARATVILTLARHAHTDSKIHRD
jgi:hypothetical protein